ncbi:MAG: hypothetical protein FWC65_06155, partial [Treponema sp.]|nr:hypothetical protein [Treponema sp.]
MIKELSWYLERGRFANLASELEGSLKRYEGAKKEGQDESALSPLREEARLLFEEHSVRSGLREEGNSFINIDAEFFDGKALDEQAKDGFIKNIVKGHCYQKNLWLYMGTTGLMTPISKAGMAKQGQRHENYLPIEYKKKHPRKKPLEGKFGKDTALFYVYGDGTVSQEYQPEKAKMKFDRLRGGSEMDFSKGWNPNEVVKKEGWHGKWDHTGTWVWQEGAKENSPAAAAGIPAVIELVRIGDTAVLHDPGGLLLTAPMLMYLTESGEPYGNLELDREKTLEEIRRALGDMGASAIGSVCGIDGGSGEKLDAYREVLKDLAAPGLEA